MVAPAELPSFHIEVKGTASAKLEYSKLRDWVRQVKGDVMHGQVPVIFNKANNQDWVGLAPVSSFRILKCETFHLDICTEISFNPSQRIKEQSIFHVVSNEILDKAGITFPYVIGFGLGDCGPIVGMDANFLLKTMLDYEARIKANK